MKTLIQSLQHFIGVKLFMFLVVGGSATVVQVVLLSLFVEVFGLYPVLASCIAYALSAIFNYLLNYSLTFSSSKSHKETFPKFLLVCIFGLCVNTLVFWASFKLLNNYLFAQAVAILVTLMCNYLLHKHWIYRTESE